MRRFLVVIFLLGAIGFWWLSRPASLRDFPALEGDVASGKYLATLAGCASCHGADYSGGEALHSPFGTFYAPNITPHAIGDWDVAKFALALRQGVVDGKHLYPAFPYKSYAGLADQEVADIYAYFQSLPSVDHAAPRHEVDLIAKWRRPLGIWKRMAEDAASQSERGAHIAENLAHCQECHSPRNALGVMKTQQAYQGGKVYNTEGKAVGIVPNLVDGESANWSREELAEYFTSGFTPEYDSAGGAMVEVIENLSQMSDEDRSALVDYVISLRQNN